jgi:hypothetical protein
MGREAGGMRDGWRWASIAGAAVTAQSTCLRGCPGGICAGFAGVKRAVQGESLSAREKTPAVES